MSATQFDPEDFGYFDPGNIQETHIDGLACYEMKNGLIRTAFYALLPIIGAHESSKTIVTKLVYTVEAQGLIRRQLLDRVPKGERAHVRSVMLNA